MRIYIHIHQSCEFTNDYDIVNIKMEKVQDVRYYGYLY